MASQLRDGSPALFPCTRFVETWTVLVFSEDHPGEMLLISFIREPEGKDVRLRKRSVILYSKLSKG